MINNRTFETKYFSIIMGLLPLFSLYPVGKLAINIGELLIAALLPAAILRMRNVKISLAAGMYVLFITYSLAITIIMALSIKEIDMPETLKRLIRDGFYIFIFAIMAKPFFDWKIFYKALSRFAFFLSIFIIIQFCSYILFKVYVPGIIKPLYPQYDIVKETILRTASSGGFIRPNGFLKEPAHCAQVLSVALTMDLLLDESNINWKKVIVISIGIALTTSANGFVYLIACYGLFFIKTMKSRNIMTVLQCVLLIVLFIGVLLVTYSTVPYVKWIVSRLENVGSGLEGSSNLRVLRGVAFWKALPLSGKLFGIGFGNFIGYKSHYSIQTIFEIEKEYMASDIYILISAGIIGAYFLIASICLICKEKNFLGKSLMILLLIMGISSSVYSSSVYAMILSMVIAGDCCKWGFRYES